MTPWRKKKLYIRRVTLRVKLDVFGGNEIERQTVGAEWEGTVGEEWQDDDGSNWYLIWEADEEEIGPCEIIDLDAGDD
jgi:hypothetical protein